MDSEIAFMVKVVLLACILCILAAMAFFVTLS